MARPAGTPELAERLAAHLGADVVRLSEPVRAITQEVTGVRVRALQPVAYPERDWNAEVYARGCYGAHLPPGAWTQVGAALRRPVGRLHFAGTETAVRWCGYIDGAISSGEQAAREVLAER